MQLTSTETNLFLLLFLAAILHSFFLSSLLLIKARNERGVVWLGLMIIPWTLWMLNYILYIGDWMKDWPHMLGVAVPFIFLIGPAYYFFIRRSMDPSHRFHWWEILHLLPVLVILYQWIPVYAQPVSWKLEVIERVGVVERPSLLRLLLSNTYLLLIFFYAFLSRELLRHNKTPKKEWEPRKKWLRQFTDFFIIFLLLKLAIQLVFWIFNWDGAIMELSLVLTMAMAIHLLSYRVLGRDRVLPGILKTSLPKYANSPLDGLAISNYQRQILNYLEQQQPWREAAFSLKDLSKALSIPQHHLSQVLSEGVQLNFHDLISKFRIEYFQQRVLEGETEKYSILGLAKDCGFGSKSSFNRAFKKMKGCTPSQWMKMQKQNI